MQKISEVVKVMYQTNNNVTNVNNTNTNNNNVINVNDRYALDAKKFTPNTEESILASDIANSFNDLRNFAYYFSVVKRLGTDKAHAFYHRIIKEIDEKKNTKNAIRFPARYFAWMHSKGL